jgi:hypothetical protein
MTKTPGFKEMVAFCTEIVDEIKRAESEKDLIDVITNSMTKLRRVRNSFNEAGFMMNMIVTLRTVQPEHVSARALNNVKLAIAIFRQFQKDNPGNVF